MDNVCNTNIKYNRGDVYNVCLEPIIGSEQGKMRPCIIVQNNIGNQHSPTLIIIPVTTSTTKPNIPTHVHLPACKGLQYNSIAIAEQIRCVDKSRVKGDCIASFKGYIMRNIDNAIHIAIYGTTCEYKVYYN